ncbi:hypothetical protein ILYODFUR_004582 [Ilyodon furcidens]|uniref:Uncharacterized protein n=1 Tax=Ilyodon furcidens TaxID=33524 RepID=A0ABV0SJC8_9TELE
MDPSVKLTRYQSQSSVGQRHIHSCVHRVPSCWCDCRVIYVLLDIRYICKDFRTMFYFIKELEVKISATEQKYAQRRRIIEERLKLHIIYFIHIYRVCIKHISKPFSGSVLRTFSVKMTWITSMKRSENILKLTRLSFSFSWPLGGSLRLL